MTLALDISNWTDGIDVGVVRQWQADGVGLVIIQAFPTTYHQFAQQQAQMLACVAADMPWDWYVYDYITWPSWRDGAITGINSLASQGYVARRIWADEEDTTAASVNVVVKAVRATLMALDLCPSKINPTGIYTGGWWWIPRTGNTKAFSDRPWWPSQYDHVVDANVITPYGGWTHPAIKQYAGTSTFDHIGNVDLDILSVDEASTLNPPQPEAPMAINPGAGMLAQMQAHGDKPLFGHKFYAEADDAGAVYSVEECFGALGRYVSSNSSGGWVNAGPF